ncbi:putative leucine-rich repeat domain superfamily [Helianthus annuus]|nr:putative leucine-rich repeat domain superfamily [Helianthus annuus]
MVPSGHFNRPDLDFLDLSYNELSGSLEQFLCSGIQEPRQLRVLNLAHNNMSGVISDCWMNWENLAIFKLREKPVLGYNTILSRKYFFPLIIGYSS